jgi:UDP-N-acetylmuramoyl-tripeptide--D-alanyl-D-alanine ligase
MMARTLAAVAREVQGHLAGPDAIFANVGIDSRALAAGDFFVAIKGERFDGHDFVADAYSHGASGALVSRLDEAPLPQIEVADTRLAFGQMARAWKRNFGIPTVAITGSNGKTTVKELTASILRRRGKVCATLGNLNNDIGVPLTLMRLAPDDRALVAELGANHAGEIDYLASLVEPTVGLITNANAAHLEGFGSIAGVAAAKGELLDRLPHAGAAVLCADDAFFADWRARSRAGTVLSFGLHAHADCTVVGEVGATTGGSSFTLKLADGETVDVELPLLGMHNVMNALAAAAAAHAVGVGAAEIAAGLAAADAVGGRLKSRPGRAGSRIVDDSYNANPASVRAALDYLASLPGQRIFVLGDMAELGARSDDLHAQVGAYARERCNLLLTIGAHSRAAACAFDGGINAFDDVGALAAALEPLLGPSTTVLVKGSRVMQLDRLVAALAGDDSAARGGARC